MTGFYRGKKVLVTGGLGFIGSNLTIELCKHGADVTVVDSLAPEYGASVNNLDPVRGQITIKIADLRESQLLDELVHNQDYVFCLAGQVSHVESMRKPLVDLDINCRCLVALLESCRKSNPSARLVLAGTRQIYGKPQYLPVTESHPINPTDVNGINKWAAEKYAALYSHVYGISTICLRLTNTYGPRMDISNGNKGFVGVFIGHALNGHILRVFGDGEQRRDFNYVSDVVDAFMLAGAKQDITGRSFNLGHEEHVSLNEFVAFLSDCIPIQFERIPFPSELKPIDIGDCYSDFTAFHQITGWQPKVGLREGLKQTIQFYRDQIRAPIC
jgi:UDP-glucose 4-epimerase